MDSLRNDPFPLLHPFQHFAAEELAPYADILITTFLESCSQQLTGVTWGVRCHRHCHLNFCGK